MSRPLDAFIPIADAIALVLKPHAEVVIHDLSTSTVYHIASGFSRRHPGDDSLTELQEIESLDQRVIGPYPKTNWDGRPLKSISAVVSDASGRPAGLFCINVDISLFHMLQTVSRDFLRFADRTAKPSVLFQNDWREEVNDIIGQFVTDRGASLAALSLDDRTALVAALDARNLFDVRNAASYIAQIVGVSRATLYKTLKVVRGQLQTELADVADPPHGASTRTISGQTAGRR
jgi:predicted transcriptional regulator YheO